MILMQFLSNRSSRNPDPTLSKPTVVSLFASSLPASKQNYNYWTTRHPMRSTCSSPPLPLSINSRPLACIGATQQNGKSERSRTISSLALPPPTPPSLSMPGVDCLKQPKIYQLAMSKPIKTEALGVCTTPQLLRLQQNATRSTRNARCGTRLTRKTCIMGPTQNGQFHCRICNESLLMLENLCPKNELVPYQQYRRIHCK